MRPTTPALLLGIALAAGLTSGLLLGAWRSTGSVGLLVPWATAAFPVVMAVVLVIYGRRVRKMVDGDPTTMTALGAARVAVLAQASARVGAGVAGFYAALVVLHAGRLSAPLNREQALASAVAAAGFVVLAVLAWVVERWCRISEDDEDDQGRGTDPEPA